MPNTIKKQYKNSLIKNITYTAGFLYITICILTHSKISLYYALLGLNLWYEKMIPTLLPFMIISGIMVRMNLTEMFTALIYPLVRPVFRVSKNFCYCMLIGFLCGFPMGARTVADMYERGSITHREAGLLLAFVNNIGPVYFTGFVLPLIERKLILPYVSGMYGIPLLYGILLRYTVYKDINTSPLHNTRSTDGGLLANIDASINAGVSNILTLGGYMILFNLFNMIPHIILGSPPKILSPIFEISGGLTLLGSSCPIYTLLILPFGGLSCIAQTYTCIKNTDLSIASYTLNKFVLTGLTALYYLLWYILSPDTFLL
ncbi:MAG: hypothetical protein LUG83_00900 [Lachnospiraceae bacterium]|nr:hypothetical protein [Lachnospiraceae bacterium]